jgi:methylated-DNA-[protein]-cysteine S-methyltransferase
VQPPASLSGNTPTPKSPLPNSHSQIPTPTNRPARAYNRIVLQLTEIDSPVGRLAIAAREGRVCLLHFGGVTKSVRAALARWYPDASVQSATDPGGAVKMLRAYFDGDIKAIDDVPVEMHGTPFQQKVWAALRRIPAGSTLSYGTLARLIAVPSAVRAVGAANGANPVALIVPCHRVIGSNGTLTGYGGGLDRKRWLLEHEGVRPQTLF